jgi:hypothetical protein
MLAENEDEEDEEEEEKALKKKKKFPHVTRVASTSPRLRDPRDSQSFAHAQSSC